MAASDVTVTQNGGQNVKLHPYLVALVRWCVSCLWSTATIVLHRIMLAPRPAITGSPKPKPIAKPRAASQEHIDPEPRVECVVLHQPTSYKLDVIFVHGLYGSLRNTWRQGEWKTKYKVEPNKVPLMRSTSIPSACKKHKHYYTANNQFESNIYDSLEKDRIESINNRIYEDITKILPNENVLITENFYDNALLEQVEIIDNYETQAQFVSDLFKSEIESSDDTSVECSCDDKRNENDVRVDLNDCECRLEEKNCRVGCGCLCDECYSTCWPRDWIKEDYPDARVISINYTSDPYLWRPLWVKEIKRLRLHERAEQMTRQLLDLGVGERPVIWVGHSKGGLFIKQIYCEAYEAHLKLQKEDLDISKDNETNDNSNINREQDVNKLINNVDEEINDINSNGDTVFRDNMKINVKLVNGDVNESKTNEEINEINKGTDMKDVNRDINENTIGGREEHEDLSLKTEEDSYPLGLRRRLWQRSAGFMFYSVPHRGSPLADIKTPLTQRSLELQEICKDCPLVLDLHSRWLAATSPRQPVVRSLVETGRTLMSVLWLRIVSKHSADPGLGALCGVSVDHREICKPASRTCLLYSELMNLMHAALDRCRCQQQPAERDVKRE